MFTKPVTLAGVGRDRVLDAARHAAERGLMQDVIDAFAGAATIIQVRMSPSMKRNLPTGPDSTSVLNFIEIALVSGREIVQPHHALIELEQSLQQIRADEAGDAGDQPGFRALEQLLAKLFVRAHRSTRFTDARRRLRG